MYVEAICPLCFASHVVSDEMRGEKFRCEECEEEFIVSKKAKRTNKKPPRPREVKPADDEEPAEVTPVDSAEVLPEANLVDSAPKKKKARSDEEEVLDIPDDAVQGGAPVVKTPPAPKRSRKEDDEEDRPKKRRRGENEDEDDRPRRRAPVRRSGPPVGLIVGISAGAVMLLGLLCIGAWWALRASPDDKAPAAADNAPLKDGKGKVADNQNPMKKEEAKKDPPPLDPNRVDEPKKEPPPPRKEPPPAEPPVVWNVKADPPAAAVKMPADFKKEIPAPGVFAESVYPTTTSPFVAIGSNRAAGDERQVWNLQTGAMTAKVVGAISASQPPILSPDGAYLAFLPATKRGTADVWALGPGKMVNIPLGTGNFMPDLFDFAGSGKLLAGRRGAANQMTVRVFDAATGKQDHDFNTARPVGMVHDYFAVSPGGAYLAVVDRESLWVYDIKTGAAAGQRALPKIPGAGSLICHGLSFSPDGREIAALFIGIDMQLVCWDVAKGDTVTHNTVPKGRPPAGTLAVYRGHVIDWVGDRRGWLLYGYTLVERGKNGSATFLPEPPATGSPIPRHTIGPEHVVTLAPGAKVGESVLTVSRFDPDKPQ
jgi:hypothetical protein